MKIDDKKLLELANDARKNSYVPYSNYSVGAALLCEDGAVFTGCNIENASYGDTICAERTAIFKAVSEGKLNFCAIAIAGSPKDEDISGYAYPCGMCRQVMREFVDPNKFIVLVAGPNGEYISKTLEEILPYSFGPEHLK